MAVSKINVLFILFFLAFCGPICAAKSNNDDVKELSEVTIFSLGNNGFVGKMSRGEVLYNKILHGADSELIFRRLLESDLSTPEAKIYALCGLVKKKVSKKSLIMYKNSEVNLSVLKGDVLRKFSYQEIYENIIDNGC